MRTEVMAKTPAMNTMVVKSLLWQEWPAAVIKLQILFHTVNTSACRFVDMTHFSVALHFMRTQGGHNCFGLWGGGGGST